MNLEAEIRQIAKSTNTLQSVIEKDFALSCVLAGIAKHAVLSETLVFKGGTALKKCYFGEYRFSEDLDFSTLDAPKKTSLEKNLKEVLEETRKILEPVGAFSLELDRYTEKQPHPKEQEAFKIGILYPWQRRINCRIKLEISHHEPVLLPPIARPLIHPYPFSLPYTINCYQLDEVVAEKMRTLLQSHQKLVANTWHRPRARDYYDLWHIFDRFGSELNSEHLLTLLEKKSQHADVSFTQLSDFFTNELVKEAQDNWDSNLGTFVKDLPDCNTVLKDLQKLISKYFPTLI